MINIMSKSKAPLPSVHVELDTLWYVDADKSYKVIRRNQKSEYLTAVRTLGGKGKLTAKSGEYILEENSVLILLENDILSYNAINENWNFWWCIFKADNKNTVFEQMTFAPFEKELLQRCFDIMMTPFTSGSAVSSLFSGVYSGWISKHSKPNHKYEDDMSNTASYIIKNINSPITVSKLAKRINMTERNFRIVFKNYFLESPSSYIENKKMESARQMLRASKITVKEAAELHGYTSPYYFSRAYKKHFGLCPKWDK